MPGTGLAVALYSIRNGKVSLSGLFSAKRRPHQHGWLPCEVEALAITASVKHFSPFIIQSMHPTTVVTDSQPCVAAYQKLAKGQFSTSPRLTTFLSTISHYKVKMKHIAGKKNQVADFASRNPPECEESCQICTFISRTEDSVVNQVTLDQVVSGECSVPYATRPAWRRLQEECHVLRKSKELLKKGSSPNKKDPNSNNIKRYLKYIQISSSPADGLLVVPESRPFQHTFQRIVVPKKMLHGLLTALHIKLNHPSKDQLKKAFNRGFFALDLNRAVECIVDNCHQCLSLAKIPSSFIQQSTAPPPPSVANKFSADIIKRNRQKILVVREYVTSFTDAIQVESESKNDIQDALIRMLCRLRSPSGPNIVVRVDPATSFQSLENDKFLLSIGVNIEIGEAKNVNKNPVSERAVSELLEEFAKEDPTGGPISDVILALTVARLNSKIRDSGLSALEMWTRRSLNGETLSIEDSVLISEKQESRIKSHAPSAKYKARGRTERRLNPIKEGDVVFLYQDRVKGKAREHYLVTEVEDECITVQKFIGEQLRAKKYKVKPEDVYYCKDKMVLPSSDESDNECQITIKLKNEQDSENTEVVPQAQEEPVQEGSSSEEESGQEGSSADVEGSITEEVADEGTKESSQEDDSFESAEESDSGDDEVAFCPVCDKEITYSDNAL